jgi:hypothetical protein
MGIYNQKEYEGARAMKKKFRVSGMQLAIFIVAMCVIVTGPVSSDAKAAKALRAAVQAVQGDATMTMGPDQEPAKLTVGKMVEAWNTVSTNENSKLLLKWETGLLNSLGGFSSIFLASRETKSGPVDTIEMTEGLLRVTQKSGGGAGAPYMVVTPAASIEPVNNDEAVDFIVEVYLPTTAVITVVSGNVRVKNLTLSPSTETVLTSCQTLYVEQGKPKLEALASSSEDLRRQVDGTTIPGTIVANLDNCPVSTPQPLAAQPRVSQCSQYSDYEFEDWGSRDVYPYNDILVQQPDRRVGVVVVLPGVGRWIIPMEVFSGWRYDPEIIGNYSRQIVLDQMIYGDQYYLEDLRLQQQQFRDMVYLAQVSGNRDMLWDAQRSLADVNIQEQWTSRRLNRLETIVAGLKQEQGKFSQRLPQGTNLFQAVSNSFNSPKNLKTVQNFRDRIKTDVNVQNQLAGMAGKELTDMRSRVAHERDPQKRLALRDELNKINQDVAQGKLPIPAKQPQVKKLVDRLTKEQDPKKVQNLQKQLGRLTKTEAPQTAQLLSPDKLTSLKQEVAKFPNPEKRNDLEARVGQLQKSVEQRKQAESTREKIDSITTQAAKQGDVRKRDELLGQLKDLGKTPSASPAVGLNLLGQRRNLETQLSIEQDKQKRTTLEKALEDHRNKQAELMRQKPEQRKQPEASSGRQQDLQKPAERQQLDRQKQTEQAHEQQLDRQKQIESQKLKKQQTEQLQKQHGEAQQHQRQQEQADQARRQHQMEGDLKRHEQEQAQQTQREQKQKQEQREQVQQQQHKQQQQQAEQSHRQQQQKQERQEQVQQQHQRQQEQAEQGRRQQQQQQQERQEKVQQQQHKQQQEQAEQSHRQQQQKQERQEQVQQQQHQRQQEQADQGRRQQQQQQQQRQEQVQQQQHKQQQQQQQQQQRAPQVQQHREQPQQPRQAPHVQQPQAPQQQNKEEHGHQKK